MLLSIQRYCQCSGHRMQGGGCPMGHDSSGCICSIVSLVLPPESATSTWSGYLLLLLVVGLAGFGWVWVAEEQLMLMMIHTQVRFGYSSWVNTQTGLTHTWTGSGTALKLTHTHTHTRVHGHTRRMRNMATSKLTLALLPLLLIYANFWPACARVRCACRIVARLLLLIFGWLCFYLSI